MFKWSEMDIDVRDKLIAYKVMGVSPVCGGLLRRNCHTKKRGDDYFCQECGAHIQVEYDAEPPKTHERSFSYSDMDELREIIEHMQLSNNAEAFDIFMRNIENWWKLSEEQLCTAICLASLKACGVEIEE